MKPNMYLNNAQAVNPGPPPALIEVSENRFVNDGLKFPISVIDKSFNNISGKVSVLVVDPEEDVANARPKDATFRLFPFIYSIPPSGYYSEVAALELTLMFRWKEPLKASVCPPEKHSIHSRPSQNPAHSHN